MRFFSKLLIFILISVSSLYILVPLTYAQAPYSSTNSYLTPNTNPDVPQNLHTLTSSLILDILSTINCYLSGTDPLTQSHQCLGWDTQTNKIGYVKSNGGLVGFMTGVIGVSFNIPVHTSQYFSYVMQNSKSFGATHSYAASVGTQGISPFLKLWVGMRNVAYLFVVIVFILVGFGIMLRIKIDPRTVMTVQNQIPKIIAGLLLITFSFAIVGALIDLFYVLTFLMLNIIASGVGDTSLANPLFTSPHPFSAVDTVFSSLGLNGLGGAINSGATGVTDAVNSVIYTNGILGFLEFITNAITGIICLITTILSVVILNPSWTCGSNFGGGLVGIIVGIALYIAVFGALFRFWMALINCYLSVIFNLILGPLRILVGGLPGSPGGGFGGWIRDICANLAVFPVSLIYIFLLGEIAKQVSTSAFNFPFLQTSQTIAAAPTLFSEPMLALGSSSVYILVISGILGLPVLPDVVKKTFKASEDAFGSAFGKGLATGIASQQRGLSAGTSAMAPTPKPGQKGGFWTGFQNLIR